MNGRLLLTLVTLSACAFPAAAIAQTSGYTDTTTTQTQPVAPTTSTQATTPATTQTTTPATTTAQETAPYTAPAETETEVAPEQGAAPESTQGVAPESAQGAAPQGAPAGTEAATGTAPSTLAYTGSEAWLVGLLGLFALVGGMTLMRSRKA